MWFDSPSITAPWRAELNGFKWSRCCSGPSVMTVIHCNGDTFKPLPFYPVRPPAGHSLSKYSPVLYLSLNICAVFLLLSSVSLSLSPLFSTSLQRHATDCNGIFLSSIYKRG